jgi:hypothetical protein
MELYMEQHQTISTSKTTRRNENSIWKTTTKDTQFIPSTKMSNKHTNGKQLP